MHQPVTEQPAGSLRISHEVIATIASYATCEIEGVASLAPYTSSIKGLFSRNQVSRSIFVILNDDFAIVDIHVSLRYGAKIRTVAEQIQKAVKEQIQNMTGIAVSKVNVYVAGVVFADPQEKEAD